MNYILREDPIPTFQWQSSILHTKFSTHSLKKMDNGIGKRGGFTGLYINIIHTKFYAPILNIQKIGKYGFIQYEKPPAEKKLTPNVGSFINN